MRPYYSVSFILRERDDVRGVILRGRKRRKKREKKRKKKKKKKTIIKKRQKRRKEIKNHVIMKVPPMVNFTYLHEILI